jgi:hypothetical protein
VANAYKNLIGKHVRKRPLRRHRRGWEDNIDMVLKETGYEGVDWIHLDQKKVKWWTRENDNE